MAARKLEVFIDSAHAGELIMSDSGQLSFAYDLSYGGPDLSIAMPFGESVYSGRVARAWFLNPSRLKVE